MVNKFFLVLVLAVIASVGWWFLSSSEEARVKGTFKAMSAAIDKIGGEPPLKGLGKARNVVALVEPGCMVEAFGKTIVLSSTVRDMTQQIIAFRAMATNLHVSFEEVTVAFSDKTTAEVTCDFFYSGDDFGWSVRDARALEATLRKDHESGRWRFVRVRLSNILEK